MAAGQPDVRRWTVGIEFNASSRTTLGVEWELQLVDEQSRHLRQEAQQILAELPELSGRQPIPPLRHELMQSQVEVVSGICETATEIRSDLASTTGQLRAVLDARSTTLICSGTHPLDDWRDQTLSPVYRYGQLVEQMQWLARRILTFGVHVHVGVRSRDMAIPIVNALARYLPHFLALTASSPYWSGHDTGLASTRAVVFGSLPTAGPPPRLPNWSAFEDYMATLLHAGTIASIKEVWWDIRPHPEYGTVEIRMFDGIPTLREVGMAAALSQCLVRMFEHQLERGYSLPSPSPWIVTDNKWRATRYGLDARVIVDERGTTVPLRDDIYELLHELGPMAVRLGCAEELGVAWDILAKGASYERQRAIITHGGSLNDVVDALVTEMRTDEFHTDPHPRGIPAARAASTSTNAPQDRGPSHAGS